MDIHSLWPLETMISSGVSHNENKNMGTVSECSHMTDL